METKNSQKRIKQLLPDLINKIAAGEVIERPASVVKEFVENSIDANATKIEIKVSADCLNIRVADNGSGIDPNDLEIAFNKHTTSKIESFDDLFKIYSFGFRGEALSSIMSISELTCTTKTKDNDFACCAKCIDGKIEIEKTVCANGTIMEMKNLFYNVPARLKFLKTAKTEFAYIQEIITAIALAHPNIAFTLIYNNYKIFNTSGSNDLLTTISQLYSINLTKSMIKVSSKQDLNRLELIGYISVPTFSRSSKKSIYVFVNRRYVKCHVFSKAIDNVYKTRLEKGKFPFVVLNLNIDPKEIDINAHPTKKEVRYKNPNIVFSFLYSAINKALEEANYHDRDNVVLNFGNSKCPEIYDDLVVKSTSIDNDSQITFYNILENKPKDVLLSLGKEEKIVLDENGGIVQNVQIVEKQRNCEKPGQTFRIIGQYLRTYILFEENTKLYIVDQHIADERCIYNKLKEGKDRSSQILLISDVFELEAKDYNFLENSEEFFLKYGYEYKLLEDNKVIFRKVPNIVSHIKLRDLLSQMLSCQNEADIELEENIIIKMACKAAVKANVELTMWQMNELIARWKEQKDLYTCPHGRPIVYEFDKASVGNLFHRV